MAYVAVKGGERAIDSAHAWMAEKRRGNPEVAELSLDQIEQQLGRAVDRVMGEGSLYDRELAALAIKQAQGDLIEAAFLLRAYRTTLPRFGASESINTGAMDIRRRISATFKDLPGGQVLGPTFDYTHRLLDHTLTSDSDIAPAATATPMLTSGARAAVAPVLPPIGRYIEPREIAAYAAFILSADAAAITGQELLICGGASL